MRTSTRSGPKSRTSEASRLAHDGSGASRVPRRASVRSDTVKSGLALSASWMAAIFLRAQLSSYENALLGAYQLMLRFADIQSR